MNTNNGVKKEIAEYLKINPTATVSVYGSTTDPASKLLNDTNIDGVISDVTAQTLSESRQNKIIKTLKEKYGVNEKQITKGSNQYSASGYNTTITIVTPNNDTNMKGIPSVDPTLIKE